MQEFSEAKSLEIQVDKLFIFNILAIGYLSPASVWGTGCQSGWHGLRKLSSDIESTKCVNIGSSSRHQAGANALIKNWNNFVCLCIEEEVIWNQNESSLTNKIIRPERSKGLTPYLSCVHDEGCLLGILSDAEEWQKPDPAIRGWLFCNNNARVK